MPFFASVCCAASALPLGGGVAAFIFNGTANVRACLHVDFQRAFDFALAESLYAISD